jgi:DNA polymerase-3 subunit gamma/tau
LASQALYRKWRSQTFVEVIGQQHITQTLTNALKLERVAHAYLFTGPRGTGKTTTARLLAKAVNCRVEDITARPCNECDICLAVNRGDRCRFEYGR